ncbi:MAG: M56 family metallopeptidase, partial [Nonlabens sp.]
MEAIVDYLLKSAGVLSIFVLVYHFLLRRLTFFNANRWFLLAGIAASILFPLIEITQTVYVEQPEQMVYLPQQLATPMAMVLEQPPVEATPFNYGMLAIYLYLAITLFFLGKMMVELSSLRSLIRSGNKKIEGKFVFVSLSRKLTPFSFFNYICYSENDQQSPELDLIIDHEKVHAREWHSIDLLVSHLFRAVFWINPLVWLLKRQIGENLEFIADSKAKIQNTSGISYERTLLSTAASHMQPALANNFFTPFIKKRILMLQKEASAQWNAYKYALILPVIVLFLYSFNVVEEIEYIKGDKAQISNSETTAVNSKELVFDITSATTDDQLEEYRKQIESQFNYQLKFDDLERDVNSSLKTISVSAKFPNREWEKGFTIELAPKDLLLIMAQLDAIKVHIPKDKTTLSINKNGSKVTIPDVMIQGDVSGIVGESEDIIVRKPLSDHTLSFKIDATSTKKDLEAMKSLFEEEYDIKFDYSKLKFKNDKIVRLKLSLDDKKGYKASKKDADTDGIDPICVTAVVKGDVAKWNLGSCKETASNSYTTNSNYIAYGRAGDTKIDSLMATVNGQFKAYSLDSLQQLVQFDMAQFDLQNLDSLQNILQI